MKAPELRLMDTVPGPEPASEPQGARDEDLPSYASVMRLRRADPESIRATYWEHHQALRILGRHLLGNAADAEDLLHEVFLALPHALERYRGDCSLRSFLIAITTKRAGKMHRGLGRYRRFLELLGKHLGGQSFVDPPGQLAERSELAANLGRELARLPFAQRAAVVLCLVEERSAAEAAEILGIPEATVRTRLFYGRQRLRERLGSEHAP